jgi:hypothetical protein
MTRDQIKKIVKLTEAIVNKRLNESAKGNIGDEITVFRKNKPIQGKCGELIID